MIKREEITEGLLLLWGVDNSYNDEYTCPAIVVEVEENWFIVRSLDDFRESDCIRIDEVSNLDENVNKSKMKICTLEEVQEYFKKRTKKLNDIVTKKTKELERAKKTLNEYQENVEAFLKKCS